MVDAARTQLQTLHPYLLALGKSFGGGLPIAAVIGEAVIMDAVPPGGFVGTSQEIPLHAQRHLPY
ncbi:hypothetical protein GCM10010869_58780 [Mesorhizobium tianshanense]|nr:hypothetical protein GCM10010869_58780 [Mesorhizobium tianshanense]